MAENTAQEHDSGGKIAELHRSESAPTMPSNTLVPANMDQAIRLAQMMSKGKLVPQHLQEAPADCLMVIEQAARWRMSPFAVAQCTSSIHGKLMFEGKLVVAALHNSGILSRRLTFDFEGDGAGRTVIVSGTVRGESEPRTVRVKLSEVSTNNEVWKKQPDQQLCYAGARVWARRHAPEVMLGVYTPDEFAEAPPEEPPPGRPALEHYPQERFEANFPAWEKAITEGTKTPEEVITIVGCKGVLTEEQKQRIRQCAETAETDETTEENEQ